MEQRQSVLVVDDCPHARSIVSCRFEEAGFAVEGAEGQEEAWEKYQVSHPDLVVTDVRMPGPNDGFNLLRRIRSKALTPVILISAYADVPTAVSAIRSGAEEFLCYPDDLETLVPAAQRLLGRRQNGDPVDEFIRGSSPAAETLRAHVRGVALLEVPTLVWGAPGSGRDTVARAIHAASPFAELPFVPIACSQVQTELPAPSGTAYLDEVEQLDDHAKLAWSERLDWLARNPGVGRVVASLARPPGDAALGALAGSLDRFTIRVPSVEERRQDLEAAIEHLVDKAARELGRGRVRLHPDSLAHLLGQAWPGNFSQVGRTLERVIAFCSTEEIPPSLVKQVLDEAPGTVHSRRAERRHRQREELRALLEECEGNLAEVARRLDLTRGAVLYRARRLGLYDNGAPRG